jgi:RNA ligase (TIGR02306 family)
MSERAMATIRRISEIRNHPNADKLDLAVIDGWQLVTAKDNNFKEGEIVVFCEIDSWVPSDVAPFLSKGKDPREYNGVKGERLRSVRLRGELSQGLILPLSVLTEVTSNHWLDLHGFVGTDVSEILNIQKWERPLNPQLAGQAKGYFPPFLRKTDQERIQNQFKRMQQEHFEDTYEVTLKLDGSSMTVYYNNGEFGVCSRNLELKINEENQDNAFIKKARELGLEEKLRAYGKNIAIQGELWGSGINGNWEGISHHEFSVFDIYDIDEQKYWSAPDRLNICTAFGLQHVPVIDYDDLTSFKSVQDFLNYAERPSINNKIAEGVVFKSLTNPDYSFKAISNSYLLNGGE